MRRELFTQAGSVRPNNALQLCIPRGSARLGTDWAPETHRLVSADPSQTKEANVATSVFFIGSEKPLRIVDDYQHVNSQLQGREVGQFTIDDEDKHVVTIYKPAIAYIRPAGNSL